MHQKYVGHESLVSSELFLKNYHSWLVEKIHKFITNDSCPILDYGAGIGALSNILRERYGITPTCYEIDKHQVAILRKNGFETLGSLDSFEHKFRFIFSSNVLEHIEDDITELGYIHDLMEKDAIFVIILPAFQTIWSQMDDSVGHFRRYTYNDLQDKLRRTNFEIISWSYFDSLGYFLAKIFKVLGNSTGKPSNISLMLYDHVLIYFSKFLDIFLKKKLGKNIIVIARNL